MSNTPTNSDDLIDSRDVIARIEELGTELDDLKAAQCDALPEELDAVALALFNADYGDELEALSRAAEPPTDGTADDAPALTCA